jgi:hypothetical protein
LGDREPELPTCGPDLSRILVEPSTIAGDLDEAVAMGGTAAKSAAGARSIANDLRSLERAEYGREPRQRRVLTGPGEPHPTDAVVRANIGAGTCA